MYISKTKIDKAGVILASNGYGYTEDEYIQSEFIFDEYRRIHLDPLTKTTIEIQDFLSKSSIKYYIAQRLKRKPQIIRKLNRFSVRLTQLQDIGGLRIIVNANSDVDKLYKYIEDNISKSPFFSIKKKTDYRMKGRDDTGYRALHVILDRNKLKLELQIRSKVQHYWAEGIERTSVIYGYHLKEKEGDNRVINYFKQLSNIFYEIESGREPSPAQKSEIDILREQAEQIIALKSNLLSCHVHEGALQSLIEKETRNRIKNKTNFNNWILIFDWNTGCFVDWRIIDRDSDSAIKSYTDEEDRYSDYIGYEVVMIGSSDISTVRETHSHYFGIEKYETILENLDSSIVNIAKRLDIDSGSRQILMCLVRKSFWNKNIKIDTLRNHYCKNVFAFDISMETLINKGLVIQLSPQGPIKLNISKKSEIESYL